MRPETRPSLEDVVAACDELIAIAGPNPRIYKESREMLLRSKGSSRSLERRSRVSVHKNLRSSRRSPMRQRSSA